MTQHFKAPRSAGPLALLLGALALLTTAIGGGGDHPGADRPISQAGQPAAARKFTTETLRGRVVWLAEALERQYGVATEPAAAESGVVLETPAGQLLPIIPDVRGRAFAVDSRLRNIDLQLLVRRYPDAGMIQVIRVFRPKPDGLYEIDYWCDVCAISMFILKDCECCQGPTRLREERVPGEPTAASP